MMNFPTTYCRLLGCFAIQLLLVGLAGGQSLESGTPGVKSDYVLQASDLLRIQVFQEEDLTREVRVSQEYTIVLPMIGSVDLRGKTLRQAEEMIRDRYDRDYLVNPQVNVMVLDYAKRTVNVMGSVNTPGAVLFPQEEELTLLDAISRAGGFNRLADRKRVKLSRTTSEGTTEAVEINTEDLIKSGNTKSYILQRDDVIFVPERIF
jgi:polysaccharide export outer membrane protein